MYYARSDNHLPKHKVAVSMATGAGEVFDGNVFAFGDQRVTDLLRTDNQFVPFETKGGEVFLLNQASIIRVVPREAESEPLEPILRPEGTQTDTGFEETLDEELNRLNAMAAAKQVSTKDDAALSMWLGSDDSPPTAGVANASAAFGDFLSRVSGHGRKPKKPTLWKLAPSKATRFGTIEIIATAFLAVAGLILAYTVMQSWTGGVDYDLVTANYDDGIAAYARGDYETALDEFEPLAESGDAAAQAKLGRMYAEGRGLPRDYRQALRWYRRAAEQGHADAQYNVGLIFRNGLDGEQDFVRAHFWLSLGATQGHSDAARRRDEVAIRMSDDELWKARDLAYSWRARHGA